MRLSPRSGASSQLPREQSQGAFGQGIDGETAVLIKGVLLGVKKKSFAAAHGRRVEPQDTLDESVGFGSEAFGRTGL